MSAVGLDFSVTSLFGVTDKIALVSEGCSRTGIAAATALVQNGARVYIASRVETNLQRVGGESFYVGYTFAETYPDQGTAQRERSRTMRIYCCRPGGKRHLTLSWQPAHT
jgi:NAD(P)-dependent dehydrogenase (short-subunit alcohol dehydrogenase family)